MAINYPSDPKNWTGRALLALFDYAKRTILQEEETREYFNKMAKYLVRRVERQMKQIK